MFRTRDYALVLATIMFLLVGIITTIVNQSLGGVGAMTASVFDAVKEESVFTAVVPEEDIGRDDRIASLRKKIAGASIVAEAEPEPSVTSEPQTNDSLEVGDVATATIDEQRELRCAGYRTIAVPWNASDIKVEEVEGARIVYKESAVVIDPLSSITSKEILLQLPVRSVSSLGRNCLSSDIVGITKSGVPIRNTDVSAYRTVGPTVLIGYALDGFPIYGTGPIATDSCGGVTISGQYRYYLSAERDVVVNCFTDVPVTL